MYETLKANVIAVAYYSKHKGIQLYIRLNKYLRRYLTRFLTVP